ncbi:MAG: hypothetical protein WA947_22005 [Phormidesmis sp.]
MSIHSAARSFRWLLGNEFRLWWRKTTESKRFWIWVVMVGLGVGGSLTLLWLALDALRTEMASAALTELPEAAIWIAIALCFTLFLFAFNQAVSESVVVLFERGDLDLLLSSPISGRVIFAVRLLSVTLTVFAGFCLFAVPASLLAILIGLPQLLGIYPALIGICLMATSLGMLVTLGLVRILGARRSRTWVQILNLVTTLVVLLGFQLPNFLQTSRFDLSELQQRAQSWVAPGSPLENILGVESRLWFLARTIWLDPAAVLLTVVVSSAIALFTIYTLAQSFVQGTQQSTTRTRRAHTREGAILKDGFNRVVLTKEWRMMRRSPYIISQAALQVLLVLPLTWVVLQGGSGSFSIDRAASFATPFLGGQLTYAFTYVCLSGEEAADLLKSAPVAVGALRWRKQLAALIPVWTLLFPVFALLIWQGYAWLPGLFVTIGASFSASFLRLWNSRPVARKEMFRQRQLGKTDLLLGLLESGSTWTWAGLGAALYAESSSLSLGLVCLAVLVLSLGYWRGRQLGSLLHY